MAGSLGSPCGLFGLVNEGGEAAQTIKQHRLLQKETPWVWTMDCQEAVHQLKNQLTTAPILAHFDLASPTLVPCDASATA